MSARKQPATIPQQCTEAAPEGLAERFKAAGRRYQERLKALGVDPGSFLPEADPPAAQAREALGQYEAELAEVRGPALPDSLGRSWRTSKAS